MTKQYWSSTLPLDVGIICMSAIGKFNMRQCVGVKHFIGVALFLTVLFLGCTSEESQIASNDPKSAADISGPIKIEVCGQGFEWMFRLSGKDGMLGTRDDILCRKDLYLPVGAEVKLTLVSKDFIYMLTNDELALKQVAIPELVRKTKLIAKKPGIYELAAGPLCGWRQLHDGLMGRVIIQSKKDFKGWSAETK